MGTGQAVQLPEPVLHLPGHTPQTCPLSQSCGASLSGRALLWILQGWGHQQKAILGGTPFPVTHGRMLTWNTVTMAHSRESKFFLSGIVSPVSVRRLNLQPNMCIPSMLGGRGAEVAQETPSPSPCPSTLCHSLNNPVRWEGATLVPFYRSEH